MAEGHRPSTATMLAFVGPCLPLSAIGLPLVVHLPTYYARHMGLPLSAVGLAFLFVRVFDIGVDPIAGSLMDHTRSRFGRFRAWLVASTPLLLLATWMLFMADKGVGLTYLWVWLAAIYVGFSFGSLSQQAWAAVLSPDYNQRSRIYAWWQTGNVIGILLILLLPAIVGFMTKDAEAAGVRAMGWFILILLPITVAFAVWKVGEPPLPPVQERSRIGDYFRLMVHPTVGRIVLADLLMGWAPGVTGILYLFYFTQVKGVPETQANILLLVFFVSGLVFGPAWSALAWRIGKHKALSLTCALLVVGEMLVAFTPFASLPVTLGVMVAAGASYSGGPLLIRAMLADAADEIRLQSGQDRTGLLYALLTATTKIGYALAGLSFVVLDAVGFRSVGANSPMALFWLQVMFIGAPSVLSLIAAAIILRHKLDAARHREIIQALAARDDTVAPGAVLG